MPPDLHRLRPGGSAVRITQQELVEEAYRLLSLEREARDAGLALDPACENGYGCPGCATMEAYRQLAAHHADRAEWDPLEVGARICAAVSQIAHELESLQ